MSAYAPCSPAPLASTIYVNSCCAEAFLTLSTLQVRRELQRLPGSPSQAAALAGLEAQAATLRRRAAAMEARSVPRPQPPAYIAVQADVQRFVTGVAALPRMQSLLRRLQVSNTCRLRLDLSMHIEGSLVLLCMQSLLHRLQVGERKICMLVRVFLG